MAEGKETGRDFGKICVFLSRSCGSLSAIVLLICGFVTLLPLPTGVAGSWGRCIAVGLIMIIMAVVMFFLEASVVGYCVGRMAFLLVVTKYMKNWMRATLYIGFAFVPLLLWCISVSTIIGLGVMFLVGAFNFILAVGQKGERTEPYMRMRLSDLGQLDLEGGSEPESAEETKLAKDSHV